ncbi:hypothetical protein D9M69_144350 [compost metagenome]
MTDTLFDAPLPNRPALPEPLRDRWQPLRIGLVDLFHYDSEEFWFRDGHLLLRGNNGTGKSKVLSLTLPFLFDAQLRSSRIEPDGDNGKKMSWNLLMDTFPRRIGYAWIEFGWRQADGTARYLTLGAGMSAVAGKAQVESWFFMIDGTSVTTAPRIGQDVWLTSEQRVVLTRERLREALEPHSCAKVFESASSYRRAIDESLFQIGPRRYEALMDTLIQLRQPQLSKKPDEAGLSHALTEALPPMPAELLADVAVALNQLEEDREQLDKSRQLEQAVRHFEHRYREYAGALTRRQARELRQAQTAFDNASEERNRAQGALSDARTAEADAVTAHDAAKLALASARERLETLQSDPANQDANRLSQAEKDAEERQREAAGAVRQRDMAGQQLVREEERCLTSDRRIEAARTETTLTRGQCAVAAEAGGITFALSGNPLLACPFEELAQKSAGALAEAGTALRNAAVRRREEIRHMEQRHAHLAARQVALQTQQANHRDRLADAEEAAERRQQADLEADAAGSALVDAWSDHARALKELEFDGDAVLPALAAWTARPQGVNPAQAALASAHSRASVRHATRQASLAASQAEMEQRRNALLAEQEHLSAGQDTVPPVPHTRDAGVREGRAGAPLWQLVDFRDGVMPDERAGLEAALEASGLLDAWITPDGSVTNASGKPILDTHWRHRAAAAGHSLLSRLEPATPQQSPVEPALIERILASVSCAPTEDEQAESWIGADGRYRLGALAGAWHKAEAVYIGHSARARARERRLAEIAAQLHEVDAQAGEIVQALALLSEARVRAEAELQGAPSDAPLHRASLAAIGAGRELQSAQGRLAQAEAQCREAEGHHFKAREQLENDAVDLQLPTALEDLSGIASAVDRYAEAIHALLQAAREWCNAWPSHLEQQERADEARALLAQREDELAAANERAETAKTRFEVLQAAIGTTVEALRRNLSEAARIVHLADLDLNRKQDERTRTGEARAVAGAMAETAEKALTERTAARAQAVERLQRFAESSLLTSALPDLTLPHGIGAWTIDPALQVARRAEQALQGIPDDTANWDRIQRVVSEELTELQRLAGALGHHATSEPNDWGFTVHVIYQNRPERPDALAAHLADDIAQRSELLSAREREILENHLEAEIASEIQRLMRAADRQLDAINEELYKRPTSTGVRYRLQWQPLSPEEGGPAGLDLARQKLLNTSSDLWSAEDRRVVGAMLHEQIVLERARAEDDPAVSGSSLNDQLARALDYRQWHRFRVQRQRDKGSAWQKLSGPASSGERALGLTVPLFAAIASFYGRGGSPHAPRLMLLDEAFAGIDDAARAHCMGLIREFDLDFVITSEREWACYAELPGVSICQLQRREGIDAVFVSRWTWDGRAKRQDNDPDRRFPDA